jgi:putative aldouronate transport system permease protein
MNAEKSLDSENHKGDDFSKEVPVITKKKRKSKNMNFRRDLAFYIMLLPGVVVLIINNYMPMVGVIIPFKDYVFDGNFFSSLFTSKFVGFSNFQFLFQSPDVLTATRNTILYNIAFIALDLAIPVTLAILMNELWSHKKARFYQSVMFLPYFISWIVISYIVYAFFNSTTGYVDNSLFTLLGIKNPIEWYSVASKWPAIIIFFHLWRYTGYNLIVYVASIAGISEEYYEAAAIDGATKSQQIWYVTIPMLKTTMVILSLIAVGRIFNGDFDLFYNVPRNTGALFSTTGIIDTYVYNALQNFGDVSMAAAAGIYQAVVGCVIVLLANFVVRKVDNESALF